MLMIIIKTEEDVCFYSEATYCDVGVQSISSIQTQSCRKRIM